MSIFAASNEGAKIDMAVRSPGTEPSRRLPSRSPVVGEPGGGAFLFPGSGAERKWRRNEDWIISESKRGDAPTTVALLFARRGPADVARLIMAKIVNPVEGVLRARARSYASKEVPEIVESALDSNRAIVLPFLRVRISATLSHCGKDIVLWSL